VPRVELCHREDSSAAWLSTALWLPAATPHRPPSLSPAPSLLWPSPPPLLRFGRDGPFFPPAPAAPCTPQAAPTLGGAAPVLSGDASQPGGPAPAAATAAGEAPAPRDRQRLSGQRTPGRAACPLQAPRPTSLKHTDCDAHRCVLCTAVHDACLLVVRICSSSRPGAAPHGRRLRRGSGHGGRLVVAGGAAGPRPRARWRAHVRVWPLAAYAPSSSGQYCV
jgi:hypothetical protein